MLENIYFLKITSQLEFILVFPTHKQLGANTTSGQCASICSFAGRAYMGPGQLYQDLQNLLHDLNVVGQMAQLIGTLRGNYQVTAQAPRGGIPQSLWARGCFHVLLQVRNDTAKTRSDVCSPWCRVRRDTSVSLPSCGQTRAAASEAPWPSPAACPPGPRPCDGTWASLCLLLFRPWDGPGLLTL